MLYFMLTSCRSSNTVVVPRDVITEDDSSSSDVVYHWLVGVGDWMDDSDSWSLLRDDLLLLSLFDLSRLDVPLSDGEDDDLENTDCDLEATEGDPVLCCLLGELP